MRRIGLALLVIACTATNSLSQNTETIKSVLSESQVVVDTVHSAALENNFLGDSPDRPVSIYLPPGYDSSPERRYPVIYFLHSYTLDHTAFFGGYPWYSVDFKTMCDDLISSGEIDPMIVVSPNAYNKYWGSHYVNSSVTGNWEDFIVKDLINYIDSNFRTLPQKESRGLAGHSMGGYGAMWLIMNNPSLFNAVYTLSGHPEFEGFLDDNMIDAVNAPSLEGLGWRQVAGIAMAAAIAPDSLAPPFYAQFPLNTDGELIDSTWQKWLQSEPLAMLPSLKDSLLQLKAIQFDVGTNDSDAGFISGNRNFSLALSDLGIPHVFEEHNGDHSNKLSERIRTRLLPFFSTQLIDSWEHLKSMNVAKAGLNSCFIDSLIYVFGGHNDIPTSLNTAQVYNTETNEWQDIASVPESFYKGNVGVINGKIYLSGGWHGSTNSWSTLDSTYEYDPEQDNWLSKKECPKQSGANASCVLNGKLYVFGGLKGFTDLSGQNQALAYDPETDTWQSLKDMIYNRGLGATACAYNGQIYVFGGMEAVPPMENLIVEKAERYDPVENTWTELADLPVPVALHTNMVYEDKIYVFGGVTYFDVSAGISHCSGIIQEYDPVTDEWRLMENMPFKRAKMTSEKVDLFAYILGGHGEDSEVLDEVWRFNLHSLKEGCKEVKIQEPSGDLIYGDSIELIAEVLPEDFGNMTIIWSSDNESVATVSQNGYVRGVSSGTANITASLKYGGCSGSREMEVIPVGVGKTEEERLSVYPNPTSNLITIQTAIPGHYNINIISLSGQKIFDREFAGPTHQIDLSSFQKGVYFITIRSKDFVTTEKIIKL